MGLGKSSLSRTSAVLVGAVVVIWILIGAVLAVRGATGAHEWSPESGAVPAQAGDGPGSLCGIPGLADSGRLTTAPEAEWRYQGTTAYPVSRDHGPGRIAPEGFRYCFQHTPEGALFAAANAVVQGSNGEAVAEWIEYATADGPYRSTLIANDGTPADQSDTRSNIVGFRILQYSGVAAHVDIAVRLSMPEGTVFGSGVYDLVWAEGDWKMSTASPEPVSMALIPDLAGYVPWGEAWSGDA